MSRRKPLLEALAGGVLKCPPVWLMRQAGRYLPEYREVRARVPSFLELCYTPELAVEVTLQPIRRFGMDAAILFSDILVVPDALGVDLQFVEGEGPRLAPVRGLPDLERLDPERLPVHLEPVYATVRALHRELSPEVTLIGFAGAPWTLAAYMVEGGSGSDFAQARGMAAAGPLFFHRLIALLTDAVIEHLSLQVEAGAEALQLFDSWAGLLPEAGLERWSLTPIRAIVAALRQRHPQVPVIVFPRGVGRGYLRFAAECGAQGLSLDQDVELAWLAQHERQLAGVCLQGNLAPQALLKPAVEMLAEAAVIVAAMRGRPFIFNLGHGVLPQTAPESVAALVRYLKSLSG